MSGLYVYIDGFNLYHRALRRTPYRWLDPVKLCERVLGEEVECVRYFTARIQPLPHDQAAPARQKALLDVYHDMDRVKVHYGKFKRRTKRGLLRVPPPPPNVGEVETFEEKGSDVNLATFALVDGYEGRASKVVLLTNDSDLAEPAKRLRARAVPVGVIVPKKGLKSNTVPADFYKTLRPADLRSSQLPAVYTCGNGREVHKPSGW